MCRDHYHATIPKVHNNFTHRNTLFDTVYALS